MAESVAARASQQKEKQALPDPASVPEAAAQAPQDPGAVGPVREAMPQVLASAAKNLLLLDVGMTMGFPTLVIAALLGSKEHPAVPDEYGLSFDEWQASWFGSLMLICQPVGAVVSGLMLEPLGRKKSMLIVNAPHLMSWILLSTARTHAALFAAAAIMGLSMGFREAPMLTYVGEITTPKLRGALTSMAGISVMLGFFIEYLFGSVGTWRTAAWCSASIPILTVIAISQVPESPMWLVSRGRISDAERSLCWLRGWVPASAVQTELARLVQYNAEKTVKHKGDSDSEAPRGRYLDGVRALRKRQTLWPLLLVFMFFVIHHWTGLTGLRPFMVPVFREFGLPIDAYWLTVLSALLGMGGNLLCMVTVAWCGKRPLALTSCAGVAMVCFALGSFLVFMPKTQASAVAQDGIALPTHWPPLALFCALFFLHAMGIGPVPWMLLAEVFPYQGRGLATSIAAAASYVIAFFAAKTFLDIQRLVNLSGVFLLYGAVATVGFVFMWLYLPETEGRSLQEIEASYVKKTKVAPAPSVQTNQVTEKTAL